MYDIEKKLEECGSMYTEFDATEVREMLKEAEKEPIELTASDPVTTVVREILEEEETFIATRYRDSVEECDLSDAVFWSPDKKRAIISFE